MSAPRGSWEGDYFLADDGRVFAVFPEHPPGQGPRWFLALERVAPPPGAMWKDVPFDGSTRRSTVVARVERHVRLTNNEEDV